MPELPTDALTFLFTDVEGSTRLWEKEPAAMSTALARHDALVRNAIEGHDGYVFMTAGDAFCAAFRRADRALAAACDAQRALTTEPWAGPVQIKARMALPTGDVEVRDSGYFGPPLNRVARLLAVGHGGQILLSAATAQLLRDGLPAGAALRDMGERRLKDLVRAERVYQLVAAGLPAEFPPLKSLDPRAQNLPIQATSFVGREQEMKDVKQLLRSSQLVTLTGPGGAGKTRLSLQIGADVVDDYADGVWFVELAALGDARLVAQAAATILGVNEEPNEPLLETLVKNIRDRELLLILDNCEHLVLACAELCDALLASCPGIRILASSRELLRIAGEVAYRVPSLPLPDSKVVARAEALTRYAAARLFIDRARAVKPSFQVSDANAPAIAAICRHLDGIPLALELAAARVRTMSVDEVNQRLDKRFHVLTGGSRTALPRQQTLRALIDWSYDLLAAAERTLFGRLAIFAAGWTLRAAEHVCAGEDVAEEDVLDLLASLVDKSLVVEEERNGATRYRMLETMREYARERLYTTGGADAVRRRHLAFYLALAEQADPGLVGPRQGEWLEQLDFERENILAAHSACDCEHDGAMMGLRLVHAIKRYWVSRGLLGLGKRVTLEALDRSGADVRNLARCRALFAAGQFGCFMGQYGEARAHLEESLPIAREVGAESLIASITSTLALAALGQDDHTAARGYFEQAIVLSRQSGNRRELAASVNGLAQLDRMEGAFESAAALYEQALAITRELGDRESAAVVLLNLALVAIGQRDGTRARPILQEVVGISNEMQSRAIGQCVLDVCAALAALRGEWARAARFFGAVEAQTAEGGYHRDPADKAFLAPLIEEARSTLGARQFDSDEAQGRTLAYDDAIDEARSWLAALEPVANP